MLVNAGEEDVDHQTGGGPPVGQGDSDEARPQVSQGHVCHAAGDQEEVLMAKLYPGCGPDDLPMFHLPGEA